MEANNLVETALSSKQKDLQTILNLYGENHPDTARCYDEIGVVQRFTKDNKSAAQ